MKRKIVQICTYVVRNDRNTKDLARVVALADDGTVWCGGKYLDGHDEFHWMSVPALPDDNSNLSKVRT